MNRHWFRFEELNTHHQQLALDHHGELIGQTPSSRIAFVVEENPDRLSIGVCSREITNEELHHYYWDDVELFAVIPPEPAKPLPVLPPLAKPIQIRLVQRERRAPLKSPTMPVRHTAFTGHGWRRLATASSMR